MTSYACKPVPGVQHHGLPLDTNYTRYKVSLGPCIYTAAFERTGRPIQRHSLASPTGSEAVQPLRKSQGNAVTSFMEPGMGRVRSVPEMTSDIPVVQGNVLHFYLLSLISLPATASASSLDLNIFLRSF